MSKEIKIEYPTKIAGEKVLSIGSEKLKSHFRLLDRIECCLLVEDCYRISYETLVKMQVDCMNYATKTIVEFLKDCRRRPNSKCDALFFIEPNPTGLKQFPGSTKGKREYFGSFSSKLRKLRFELLENKINESDFDMETTKIVNEFYCSICKNASYMGFDAHSIAVEHSRYVWGDFGHLVN